MQESRRLKCYRVQVPRLKFNVLCSKILQTEVPNMHTKTILLRSFYTKSRQDWSIRLWKKFKIFPKSMLPITVHFFWGNYTKNMFGFFLSLKKPTKPLTLTPEQHSIDLGHRDDSSKGQETCMWSAHSTSLRRSQLPTLDSGSLLMATESRTCHEWCEAPEPYN